jgi:16S rRNA (guanine527-N7)-methyltransferase
VADDETLTAALAVLQRHGHIGQPLVEAVAHSDCFARAVPAAARTLVDLGSGGGLPGLVIADRCPHLKVTLVERRQRRGDDLRRAVRRLGFADRVEVVTGDVDTVSESFDVVSARAFAAPTIALRAAMRLLAAGGVALISDPPAQAEEHWQAALSTLGDSVIDLGSAEGIHRFRRRVT